MTRANLVIQGSIPRSVIQGNDGDLIDLVKKGQGVLNILPLAGVKDDLDTGVHKLRPRARKGNRIRYPRVTALTADPPPAPQARTALPHDAVEFHHNSERQFAQLLDFYGIEWQYEPHTFVLGTRSCGAIRSKRSARTFFLPAYGLYIEITTLKQKLVTKKNRKVRKLQEQHPELKVTILYQRDYLNLLVKYGLESPEQLAGYGDVASSAEQGDSLLALGIFERPATS